MVTKINIVEVSVKTEATTVVAWDMTFTFEYKEYSIAAIKQGGKWAYAIGMSGSEDPFTTMLVAGPRNQWMAVQSLLLMTGMHQATATDAVGTLCGHIKGKLSAMCPL